MTRTATGPVPDPDLRPIPGRTPATAVYGFIPQKLLDAVKRIAMTELAKRTGD